MKRLSCIILFSLSLLSLPVYVFADPPVPLGAVPSSVEPGQAAGALAPIPTVEGPLLPPSMQIEMRPGLPFSEEVAKFRFTLKRIKILNPVIFTPEQLTAPFQKYIGKTITLGELQEIADSITTRYQQEGYVLTQAVIPPQRIKEGVVILQVVPGFVDKVKVSGEIESGLRVLLENYGAKIQASRPLQMKDLERYTLLANDIPGVRVRAVLTPSRQTPGAADLLFVSEQKAGSGYVSLNNYGTRYLGPYQLIVGAQGNSLLRTGDVTQAQIVTTINKQINFGELRHTELMNDEGLQWGIFGQYLRTNPGSTLAPLDIQGRYTVVGTELIYPWIRARQQNVSLKGGLMVLQSKTHVLQALFYDDRVRSFHFGFTGNYLDKLQGINQIDMTLTKGLKIWGASGNTLISRPNGKSDFTKVNATLSRLQPLVDQLSLFVLAQGQYSFNSLLAMTQFGFGGSNIGRGYDPSEIIGDQGVGGTVELRYDAFPLLEKLHTQLYGFYDAGKIWNRDKIPSIARTVTATSTGLGVRLSMMSHAEANFFIAKPLSRNVAAYGNRRFRVFFGVVVKT